MDLYVCKLFLKINLKKNAFEYTRALVEVFAAKVQCKIEIWKDFNERNSRFFVLATN